MIEAERKKGPTLVFDSGNALFRVPGGDADPQLAARAQFILSRMGSLGTKVMAVGQRDLNAGAPWLVREARTAGVTALSANLFGPEKQKPFAGSAVVTEGGVRVGFIGVIAPGPYGEFTAGPPLTAVRNELPNLKGKADIVIVLAATSYADALQLSQELKGGVVDFIVQSGEVRGVGMAQKGSQNFLMPSGERGRAVGKLELTVGAKKEPFSDLGEKERALQTVTIINNQLAEVQKRKAAAKDKSVRAELENTEKQFLARKKQAEADAKAASSGRAFKLTFVGLGSDVADDPAWKAEVDRIDPPASRGH